MQILTGDYRKYHYFLKRIYKTQAESIDIVAIHPFVDPWALAIETGVRGK